MGVKRLLFWRRLFCCWCFTFVGAASLHVAVASLVDEAASLLWADASLPRDAASLVDEAASLLEIDASLRVDAVSLLLSNAPS
jgi:hypothetical protein